MYINDICNNSTVAKLILFADDKNPIQIRNQAAITGVWVGVPFIRVWVRVQRAGDHGRRYAIS